MTDARRRRAQLRRHKRRKQIRRAWRSAVLELQGERWLLARPMSWRRRLAVLVELQHRDRERR